MFSLKTNVVVFGILWRICGCFYVNLTGKWKKNFRTVYSLFDHWNTTFCSDFRRLTTLLVTRSVFLLFWRWQPVAHALYQPQNAAVLKRRQTRTSETAIRASRKSAGPYVWSLLPGACHWNSSVGFASWPFGGGNTTWIFDCLNCSCIKGLQCCLDGLLHVPARPRRSQIKKLCAWGNYHRHWRTAKVWCICWRWNIVEYKVLDFAIVGVVFWKPKFVVASWSYRRMKKVHFFRW